MTTNPGGREGEEEEEEEPPLGDDQTLGSAASLTVTREDLVKGVVMKGIVCTPKTGPKHKGKSQPGSTQSLNPFEKRKAPKPPPALSDSVPKTKATKKRGMSKS